MPARILVAGTIAIDDIITPSRQASDLLGGSAAFASVAARLFALDIDVLSIIGSDFPEHYRRTLERKGINLDGVTRRDGPSFHWTGEYFDDMNKRRTVKVSDDVMLGWNLEVPQAWKHHPVVIASCMVPARQLELIMQCREPQLVLSDSMDKWITRQPELLDAVIARSHICTMNEAEAKIYARCSNLIDAGEHMLTKGARYAIIKQGEYGSALFGRRSDGSPELFRCPAWPLREVVDPTGAGDTFLGAIGGYLSTFPDLNPSFDSMKKAVIRATVASSFTCESLSADALIAMTRDAFEQRLAEFISMIRPD